MIDQEYVLRLRGRQRFYVRLLLLCFLLVPIGIVGMVLLPRPIALWLGFLPDTALLLVLLLMVPFYRFGASPCPRCGQPFHHRGGFLKNMFLSARLSDRRCIHCGFMI
jgi:hypothetical protein